MFEQLKSLDAISINFSEAGVNTINIVLAFIMFGVALGIKKQTFSEILKKPKSLLVGIFLQWIALPAMTMLFIMALGDNVTPMVAMGMLLVASCPGGNVSNFMSSYARGNVELSVSMTAIATCFATFTTPINFAIWSSIYCNYASARVATVEIPHLVIEFLPMFKQVVILLGLPVILGVLFARRYPEQKAKIEKPFQVVSLLFFIALVVIAFTQNFTIFVNHISYVFLIVLVHNLIALSLGYFGATAFRLPERDRRSLAIEVGIQNSGLGLVLLFNPDIFPQEGVGGMLFITAWWGVWHIVGGLVLSTFFRRRG